MAHTTDPTFYRSPAEAVAAPPERLAYVAAYDPAGQAKDAMAVVDVEASSAAYGAVVGWCELPRPVTSCTTLAGTPAPAPCAMAATASRWSAAT